MRIHIEIVTTFEMDCTLLLPPAAPSERHQNETRQNLQQRTKKGVEARRGEGTGVEWRGGQKKGLKRGRKMQSHAAHCSSCHGEEDVF